MRTLTIKRKKSFIGCLGTMKVYMEDSEVNELVINGVPCRMLGTLKNGEEKQFSIDEQEAKIFVIADKLTKGFCNEVYKLPAGTEDIALSGRNHYNWIAGNPFRFDGQTDPEALENRKKSTRKGILVICSLMLVCSLIGCAIGIMAAQNDIARKEMKEKTFVSNGMEITLNDAFWESEFEGYTATFSSRKAVVFALQEEFDLVPGFGDYTLEEYGQLVLQANGLSKTTQLQKKNGLTYFEYEREVSEKMGEYYYLAVVYKASNAFWLIQFSVPAENKDDYQQDFLKWAESVEFT